MKTFIPLIYTLLGLIFTKTIFKKKNLLELLPISILISVLMVFVLGFIFKISTAIKITFIIFVVVFIYNLYKKNYRKLLNMDILVIFLLYIFITVLSYKKGFGGWDDYSHWGVMIKEMLRLDTYYSVDESVLLVHKNYPPITTLIGVIWSKLYFGFSEAYLIRAFTFTGLSFFVGLLKKKSNFILIIVTTCLFKEFAYLFYNTIYSDPFISISIAYVLYLSFIKVDEIDDFVILSIALSFMVLIKQVSLAFYFLSCMAVALNMYFIKKKINFKYLLILLVPLLFYFLWEIYIRQFEIKPLFNISDIDFIFWYKKLLNNDYSWQHITGINFFKALFNRPQFYYFSYMQISAVLSIIIYFLNRKTKGFIFSITYMLGALGYGFMMMLIYMYTFGPIDGPLISSFDRYMSSYLVTGIFLILYFISEADNKIRFLYSIIIVLLANINLVNLKPALTYKSMGDFLASDVEKIKGKVDGEGVFVIAQYDNGQVRTMLNYYLNPKYVLGGSIGEPKYEGDVFSVDMSLYEFKEKLLKTGNLYIYKLDDVAYNDYLMKVANLDFFEEKTLYKVSGVNDKLILIKVE